MGNNCCVENAPTGPCITPSIQCQSKFIAECNDADHVCTTVQQSNPLGLTPGVCSSVEPCCNGQSTWLYDDPNNTCDQQAWCGNVDLNRCIFINDNASDICAGVPGVSISTHKTSTIPVTCKWLVTETFNTLDRVNEWEKLYGLEDPINKKNFNTKIMPNLCSMAQLDTTNNIVCPKNNNEGINAWVEGICSPFVSNNAIGRKCFDWLKTIDPSDTDTINAVNKQALFGYCEDLKELAKLEPSLGLKNGEVNECLCINRGKDPTGLFNQIITTVSSNPKTKGEVNSLGAVGCWYEPCNAPINQLRQISPGVK